MAEYELINTLKQQNELLTYIASLLEKDLVKKGVLKEDKSE